MFANKLNNTKQYLNKANGIKKTKGSRKKKNTYIVNISSPFFNASMFELCRTTPLYVEILNGVIQGKKEDWHAATHFENPAANEMATNIPAFNATFGPVISKTIIEYLDKYTGKPVVRLFPHTVVVLDGYENNFMSHLNHATRRNFIYEINKRKNLIQQYNQNTK